MRTALTRACAWTVCLAASAVVRTSAAVDLGFDAKADPGAASIAYFVQASRYAWKLVLPNGRMCPLWRSATSKFELEGPEWHATMMTGGVVRAQSVDGKVWFDFLTGRSVAFRTDGVEERFDPRMFRQPPDSASVTLGLQPHARELAQEESDRLREQMTRRVFAEKWRGTGRLTFPYGSPNISAVLYATLLLCGLVLALCRRKAIITIGVALLLAAGVALLWTGSRGAWIATAVGSLCFFPRGRKCKLFWLVVVGVCVLAFIWLFWRGTGDVMRGFRQGEWSNAVRVDLACAAPAMMMSAPEGWGGISAGQAYGQWFGPVDSLAVSGTLMNSHLDVLVQYGRSLRWLYLFAWTAAMACCLLTAWVRRFELPLAVVVATFLCACFNPVLHEPTLWLLPGGLVVAAVWRLPWKCWHLLVAVAVAVTTVATLALAVIEGVGLYQQNKRRPKVEKIGRVVHINGTEPRIWLVDDGDGTFGDGFAPQDLREVLAQTDDALSIARVERLADLPEQRVDCLVLSARAGHEWLLRLSLDPKYRRQMPRRVCLVSPPYALSSIPPGVKRDCNVTVIMGEYLAMRDADAGADSDVRLVIIPGREKYIPDWIRYVVLD